MATPTFAPTEDGNGMIASYAFDVDLDTGLEESHLKDLTQLLRTHADARQLERMLANIGELLRQQRVIGDASPRRAGPAGLSQVHRISAAA